MGSGALQYVCRSEVWLCVSDGTFTGQYSRAANSASSMNIMMPDPMENVKRMNRLDNLRPPNGFKK